MRFRLVALLAASSAVVAAAFACSPAPDQEPAAADESAIINGQADTTHSAVVALLGTQSLCTGTIIKKDLVNKIGWVLTAAHCVGASGIAYESQDFSVRPASLRYQVIDVVGHPGFNGGMLGGGHDFAVVRIAGVGADTPVIPIEEENDPTAIGDTVTSVGFGKTSPTDSGNSKRNSVTKPVHDLDDKFVIYEQTQNGICSGDSGGPVIRGDGANARVVGVHSFVIGRLPDGGAAPSICMGMAVSGRPKSDLDFIRGELNKPLPTPSCSLCGKHEASAKNECAQLVDKCLDNEECANYSRCIRQATGVDGGAPPPLADGGVPPTTAQCVAAYPRGEGPQKAATTCTCARSGCNQACAAEPKCANVPKCGIALPAADNCTTCTESNCCAETQACAADGDCYLCLKNGDASNPACATMALRSAMKTCTATKCASACGGNVDGGTSSSSSGGPDAGPRPDGGSSGSSSGGSSSGSAYDAGSSGGSSSGKSSSGTTQPDEEEEDPVGSVDENSSGKPSTKPSQPKKPATPTTLPTAVEPSCSMSPTSSSSTGVFGLIAIALGLTFLNRRRR